MKIHITNPCGFLGRYLSAEAIIRGHRLVEDPACADAAVLVGWRYSDPERSIREVRAAVDLFRGQTVVGIGSQSELWTNPGPWSDYAAAKVKARDVVLNSQAPVKNWVRLSSIAGRGMARGRLVLDALTAIRRGKTMTLQSTGQELVSVCDVRLIAQNVLDLPESGTHIRNGWGERAPVTAYLESWGVPYERGAEMHNSTPPAFDERDWNGWIDVGFTPEEFSKLRHNHDQMEIA